ncbi:MAG: hypothetical protein WC763_06825 [Candidatus Paceibacterota bacterium]|jgi:hypothetical protein
MSIPKIDSLIDANLRGTLTSFNNVGTLKGTFQAHDATLAGVTITTAVLAGLTSAEDLQVEAISAEAMSIKCIELESLEEKPEHASDNMLWMRRDSKTGDVQPCLGDRAIALIQEGSIDANVTFTYRRTGRAIKQPLTLRYIRMGSFVSVAIPEWTVGFDADPVNSPPITGDGISVELSAANGWPRGLRPSRAFMARIPLATPLVSIVAGCATTPNKHSNAYGLYQVDPNSSRIRFAWKEDQSSLTLNYSVTVETAAATASVTAMETTTTTEGGTSDIPSSSHGDNNAHTWTRVGSTVIQYFVD